MRCVARLYGSSTCTASAWPLRLAVWSALRVATRRHQQPRSTVSTSTASKHGLPPTQTVQCANFCASFDEYFDAVGIPMSSREVESPHQRRGVSWGTLDLLTSIGKRGIGLCEVQEVGGVRGRALCAQANAAAHPASTPPRHEHADIRSSKPLTE
jgi:hypothetical protein